MDLCKLNAKKEQRGYLISNFICYWGRGGLYSEFQPLCSFPSTRRQGTLASSLDTLGWWQEPGFLQQRLMGSHSMHYVSWRKMTVHSEKSKNMISDWRGKTQASVRFGKSHFSSHLSVDIVHVLTSYWKVLNDSIHITIRQNWLLLGCLLRPWSAHSLMFEWSGLCEWGKLADRWG